LCNKLALTLRAENQTLREILAFRQFGHRAVGKPAIKNDWRSAYLTYEKEQAAQVSGIALVD
jgi:hypothetical protein